MNDPHRLQRFVDAQDYAQTYQTALDELRSGRKRSHWMWFVFPQVEGLGQSATSRKYAISSLAEARAYVAHPVLGPRLRESTRILRELEGCSAQDIFGGVDAIKLRSSMTLFAHADPADTSFEEVLDAYFGGAFDKVTERLLGVSG
jgi:uncharacterized protein (DUF1810 family)